MRSVVFVGATIFPLQTPNLPYPYRYGYRQFTPSLNAEFNHDISRIRTRARTAGYTSQQSRATRKAKQQHIPTTCDSPSASNNLIEQWGCPRPSFATRDISRRPCSASVVVKDREHRRSCSSSSTTIGHRTKVPPLFFLHRTATALGGRILNVDEAPKGAGMGRTVPITASRLWLGWRQLLRHLLSALLRSAKAGTEASENVGMMKT